MGDEETTKLCTNCQRNIPAPNFTIHSVHCTRNITICPNCKEPFPTVDMKTHLAHVPCKQCGEKMQSCDMAAHQTDACSQTAVQCPHCELSLGRALMGDHEVYCGARTERCTDCGELVMVKYRALHEDSNHGFLKLDDEPGPQASWKAPARPTPPINYPKYRINKPPIRGYESFDGMALVSPPRTSSNQGRHPISWAEVNRDEAGSGSTNNHRADNPTSVGATHFTAKRTNDMPQLNSASGGFAAGDNHKESVKQAIIRPSTSKGAIKKYQAPQPPNGGKKQKEAKPKSPPESNQDSSVNYSVKSPPPFTHIRDVPMYSALLREQYQTRQREELNAYNLQNGIPPVLNPAQKLDKLRKLSALQNSEMENSSKPKKINKKPAENVANPNEFAFTPMSPEELNKRLLSRSDRSDNVSNGESLNPRGSARQGGRNGAVENLYETIDYSPTLWENPSPASTPDDATKPARPQPVDRFMEIKNDLRSLRKELKEVSSPLEVKKTPSQGAEPPTNRQPVFKGPNRGGATRGDNLQLNLPVHNLGNVPRDQNTRNKQWNLPRNGAAPHNSRMGANFVKLPCEYCEQLVLSDQLLDHEQKCKNMDKKQITGQKDFLRFLANENIVNGMESNAWSRDPAQGDWTSPPNSARSENTRSDVAITPESPGYNTDNWGYPKGEDAHWGGNLRAKVDNPSANSAKVENVRDVAKINNPKFNNTRLANARASNPVVDNPSADDRGMDSNGVGTPRLDNEWPANDRVQVKSPETGWAQDARTNNLRTEQPEEKVDNSWVNAAQLEAYERHSPIALEDLGMDNGDLNDVMIPCEFCNIMVSATDFVTHETGCNPLATSILPPKDRQNRNAIDNAHTAPPNTPDGHPAPRAKVNAARTPRPLAQMQPNQDRQRIERMNQHIDEDHQNVVVNSPEEAMGPYNFEDFEVKLPCEFCMSLIPAGDLMNHQEICFAD